MMDQAEELDSAPPLSEEPAPVPAAEPSTALRRMSGNVTMSRALAESAHGLTLNEARVMMLAMREVDPRASRFKYAKYGENVKVKITAAEFAELAGLKPNADTYTPRAAYEGLKAACDKLYERSASWTEGKKQIRMRWTYKAIYHEREAWAEIYFSPDMTPHIFTLGERFVRYRIEFARGLRSVYSTSLLRLLMTQKDTGFKTITLEDFRRVMDVPDTYRYADIKRYAITPAVKELNDKADLVIEWKETKRGRSVHSLQFTFRQAEKHVEQQVLDL